MKKLRYLKTIAGGTKSLGTFTFEGAITLTGAATLTGAVTIVGAVGINGAVTLSGTATSLTIGACAHGIRFSGLTAGDVTNSFINIGDYTTALTVTPTSANMFGVMHNVALTVNVAYWYQAYYTKITTSGTTTGTSIAGHALRLMVGSNLAAVYGIQSHVVVSGARTFTSEVTAGSFYLDVGSTTISNAGSRVNALQAVVIGSSAVTCAYFTIASFTAATNASLDALIFIGQSSVCTADAAIELDLDGTVTNVFEFNGSVCDAFTVNDRTSEYGAFDQCVEIPVKVEGVSEQLYIMAAETWADVA